MRTYAREVAFSWVYRDIMCNEKGDLDYNLFDQTKLDDDDKIYASTLVNDCMDNIESYRQGISDLSRDFSLDRVFKIDLALLVMAMCELDSKQAPVAVVINETLTLARRFSTDKSVSYINGVLSNYVKQK
ncbi:MAG: transcription antitermination factor NusB [Clostridia bacterium]|nr:transcription antitermination factor NusB [Clostridia bacterium]